MKQAKETYEQITRNTGLFYKQTDGGAEYLCLKPVKDSIVGDIRTTIIRFDGTNAFFTGDDTILEIESKPQQPTNVISAEGKINWERVENEI